MAKRKPPRGRRPGRDGLGTDSSDGHSAGHRPAPARPPGKHHSARPAGKTSASALWLYGDHAVIAALANPRRRCLRLVATDGAAAEALLAAAPGAAAPSLDTLDRAEIDALLPPGAVHQGVALLVAPLAEQSVADICAATRDDENARVIVLDQVTDPQNVGAILRSAATFGAVAVIVQDRHAPPVTGALARAASGALEHVALVRAVNLNRALGELKDAGFWTIGLAGEAPDTLAGVRPDGKAALVLGAEGPGLRRLTREACDVLARIPMPGTAGQWVDSLNVSNAAAVALYELTREL